MEIKKLQVKSAFSQDNKVLEKFDSFQKLIDELNKRGIPPEMVNAINLNIDEINNYAGSNKEALKRLRTKQSSLLKKLEKDLKLVTLNHYRNLWLMLGMSAFGLPIGVAIGISVGNIGLLAVGLPIGMGMGIAVGAAMDKKAKEAGNQLDVEIKY